MIGIAGLGLLSTLLLKEIPMAQHTDDSFGLHEEKRRSDDEEKTVADVNVVSPLGRSAKS